MDVNRVKELVDLMKANDLSELEIVDGQTRIILKRGPGQTVQQIVAIPPTAAGNGVVVSPASAKADQGGPSPAAEDEGLVAIKSPLVGTFYATPSPNAEAFVKVGSSVDAETVVCIVEAMKVMNEVKAQVAGKIKKVLVNNGQSVEYGQPLFMVEPG